MHVQQLGSDEVSDRRVGCHTCHSIAAMAWVSSSWMTRQAWDNVKSARADSPARRRGYERSGRAIRLAAEVRELREKRGLSQRELAERLGTTQSAVARLEAGHVSPSLPTLDKLADALGVELVVGFVDVDDRIAG
jgi:ribosome-binding protein aMBF1 (putative translation factor)